MRIVSLDPGLTDSVIQLGLGESLVGATHLCELPPFDSPVPRVTRASRFAIESGAIELDAEALRNAEPDIVLCQSSAGPSAMEPDIVLGAFESSPRAPEIVFLAPKTVSAVLDGIQLLGRVLDRQAVARGIAAGLRLRVRRALRRTQKLAAVPRVAFLESIEPMATGEYWIPQLIEIAGGKDGLGIAGKPSRAITWRELAELRPDVLVISVPGSGIERVLEQLPKLHAHPDFETLPCVRKGRVLVFDGVRHFHRVGPSIVDSLEMLAHALHPNLHPRFADMPEGVSVFSRVTLA
jgi:iron complex transport system substrate-binding protein